MNYIREINAFYDWLETNTISDSAISLWHALMHINNKSGWKTEFAVAISTLETKTGLKKDAVIRARNRLQQVGRITFKSRNGQQSAIYTIVPFIGTSTDCVGLNDTNCDTNHNANRAQTATQTTTQTASINKLNSKQNKTNKYTPEFEAWYSSWPRSEAKADSFKNFEKRRKEYGLDFILQCSTNYLNYLNSFPEDKRPYPYQSNNFFGQKTYFLDHAEAKVIPLKEKYPKNF